MRRNSKIHIRVGTGRPRVIEPCLYIVIPHLRKVLLEVDKTYVFMLRFLSIRDIVCRFMQCFSSLVKNMFLSFFVDVDVVLTLLLCNIISLYVTANKLRVGISN